MASGKHKEIFEHLFLVEELKFYDMIVKDPHWAISLLRESVILPLALDLLLCGCLLILIQLTTKYNSLKCCCIDR